MKAIIIHGQNHKGSTYHIARMLAERLECEISEFFLPKEFREFCTGCTSCFMKGETLCPHYDQLLPITKAMDEADVIILASPVYVYHATAPMKNWLDHYGYRWMVHRPEEAMFRKQAVCIATAAGAGMKSTNRDMADSLFFWGVPKIYKLGFAVHSTSFQTIDPKKMSKITKEVDRVADKIKGNYGRVKPGLKTKGFFHIMRMLQKKGWNPADVSYWEDKGWRDKGRPWK